MYKNIIKKDMIVNSEVAALYDKSCSLLLIYMLQAIYYCKVPTYVLGDDSIFATSTEKFTFEQAYDFFASLGLTLSDKTIITRDLSDIVFLGHNF